MSDVFFIADPLDLLRHCFLAAVSGIVAAVQGFDAGGNFFFAREHWLDPQTCRQFQCMETRDIQRIGRSDDQFAAVDHHRHYAS
jgi:hypothetical protein